MPGKQGIPWMVRMNNYSPRKLILMNPNQYQSIQIGPYYERPLVAMG
jgi:hypothetical protein